MTGSSFDTVIRSYGNCSLGLNVTPLVKLHGLVRGSVVHLQLFNKVCCSEVDRPIQVQGGSYCIILDRATISELGLKKGSKIHVNFSKVIE